LTADIPRSPVLAQEIPFLTDKHEDAATDLLIKEVDEELRQDQLHAILKKYGNVMIAGALALVLGVAGFQGWRTWQAKQAQAASGRYAEAGALIEQGKRTEGTDLLSKLAADGTKGYKVLARLKLAELRQADGDVAGAAGIYEQLAADSSVEDAYRELATLKAAYLELDGSDPAAIEKKVEKLAAESSPWRHSAREVQALAALKKGDEAKGVETLRKLAEDNGAPQGVRARAAELLSALGRNAKG
jgi:hypothetical protein